MSIDEIYCFKQIFIHSFSWNIVHRGYMMCLWTHGMMIGNEAGNLTSYLFDEVSSSLWVIWDTDLSALLWCWKALLWVLAIIKRAGKWGIRGCKLAWLCGQSYKEVWLPEVRSLTHWRQLTFKCLVCHGGGRTWREQRRPGDSKTPALWEGRALQAWISYQLTRDSSLMEEVYKSDRRLPNVGRKHT